ncbi:MAG: dihydroorotate dehydrogenase electron transfer subunit [Omnitrophica bacterium]|nr:dihydroorotate dehydrogenase electron transfer subunit [Candidatus Omnitrophota bacterium]
MQQFKAKILSNKKIAPDHYVLSFKPPKAAGQTTPGQFFNIRVSNAYNPLLRRPFGAHRISPEKIEILYKVVGKATSILSAKKKGSLLDIIGPLGNGFKAPPDASAAILVAGGHGVAPLHALAASLTAVPKVVALIGARTKTHVISENEFKGLGAKVHIATEDGSKGHKGLVTDLLRKHFNRQTGKPANRQTIYACGPKAMLKAVAKIAREHCIPCQVSLEEYVACGTGACLGCAVKTRSGYKLICKDGPVFDSKEIIW